MAHTDGKISQFLKAIRDGLVQDIPPEYQACEACREATCSTDRAATCPNRLRGEAQEKRRRRQSEVEKS